MKSFIIARLKEKSTWTAISGIAVSIANRYFGFTDAAAVDTIVMSVMAIVLVFVESKTTV